MLTEVLRHIHNFFPVVKGKKSGEFTIEDGSIDLPFLKGQYFLIEGSILNDGVHLYPATDLADETFNGTITPLAIPSDLLKLVKEIETYEQKNQASPFQSESFGGYSYTKMTTKSGNAASWKDVFGSRLNAWRKA